MRPTSKKNINIKREIDINESETNKPSSWLRKIKIRQTKSIPN
jgi:hypothetical protein